MNEESRLDFEQKNEEDLQRLRGFRLLDDDFMSKVFETEPVRLDDYTRKKMTFFHDPDGLPLEIHE